MDTLNANNSKNTAEIDIQVICMRNRNSILLGNLETCILKKRAPPRKI
ncbi:hypothetical protein AYI68_g7062, partial [Smittium mucronatum]